MSRDIKYIGMDVHKEAGGNIPDFNHADGATSLASIERVLRPDRARVVVDQILHKTVGTKKRVGQTRGLNVLFRIAMPAREH